MAETLEALKKKKAAMDKELAALKLDNQPLLDAIKAAQALLAETKKEPD